MDRRISPTIPTRPWHPWSDHPHGAGWGGRGGWSEAVQADGADGKSSGVARFLAGRLAIQTSRFIRSSDRRELAFRKLTNSSPGSCSRSCLVCGLVRNSVTP